MRLEMRLLHIEKIRFGAKTEIRDRELVVDRSELTGLLQEEPLFHRVEVELAHPGESCRIINILDVLEPRCRLSGPNFPGALDPVGLVGAGRTQALKNVLVIETSQIPLPGFTKGGRSLLDMAGPGAIYTPFAGMHTVVLLPHPVAGADADEYRLATKKAGLRTAVYLAEAAKETVLHETEIYELPPVSQNQGPGQLPRVCYIFPIHSQQHPTHQKESVFYGSNVQGLLPTVVHPNEILDGALVFAYSAFTYHAQNHPVIEELYRRHGRDLWFAGVVLTLAPVTIAEKQRNAALAARLAKEVLGADGVIATKIGGGAVDTDLMLIHDRCEAMGMRAVLIIMERYPDTGITFVPPNVKTLVTPGLTREAITLPEVRRVIGGDFVILDNRNPDNTSPSVPSVPAHQELRPWIGDIAGAISQVGASRLTTYTG